MKIWVDDIRPAPEGWLWFKTTNDALCFIVNNINNIEIMSLDHDAGANAFGGDFINVLKELERLYHQGKITVNFPILVHSMNPVGKANMIAIIRKNGWKEK